MATNRGCFCFFLSVIICVSAGSAYAEGCPSVDLNGDCRVDLQDLKLFTQQWLDSGEADFDGLNGINFVDFAILANSWLTQGVPLVINEFMASNNSDSGFHDPAGDYDDWIEIYNFGDTPIDLAGMYLTDNLANPTKWRFPSGYSSQTTVPAKGFIVIWADDEAGEGPLHASFKLSADGEEIGLFDSDGNTAIDTIVFGPQTANISYGRYPDGPHDWRFMAIPTPGAQNNAGYLGFVGDVDISHVHGFYDSSFVVELFCGDANATIKYTLDGNTPTDTLGLTYNPSVRIPITGTTCLRAAAFRPGYESSSVNTATYIFLNDVKTQSTASARARGFPWPNWVNKDNSPTPADYAMDSTIVNDPSYSPVFRDAMTAIPTFSIVMDMKHWFDPQTGIYSNPLQGNDDQNPLMDWERPVSIEYFDPCTGQDFQINAGLRISGQDSRNVKNPKHSLRAFFKSEYGPSMLDFPLYDHTTVNKFNTITFRSQYNQNWLNGFLRAQYVRDPFAQDTLRDMGYASPDSKLCHLYVNGLYWGLYQASERPDKDFLSAHLGGDKEQYDVIQGAIPNIAELMSGQSDSWDYMLNLCRSHSASNPLNTAQYAVIQQYLDVNEFIDYVIYNTFVCNWDWPAKNYYVGSLRDPCDVNGPPLGKWNFYSWDSEITLFLDFQMQGIPFSGYTGPPGDIHNAMHNNPDYNRLFGDRVQKILFNNGAMTEQKNIDRYNARAVKIKKAIIGESARWGDYYRTYFDSSSPVFTPANWAYEWDRMINPAHPCEPGGICPYFPSKTNASIGQYQSRGLYPPASRPAPAFSQFGGDIAAGGTVTVTGSGTIKYTTDGREPKDYGTTIASGGTVTINNSLTLKARAYYSSSSNWSALNEATFAVGPVKDKLRITELMFHPTEPNDPGQEFVELKNIGTTTLNLNLVKFTDGIHFTFPSTTLAAGGYVLVVEDINAFNAKYGAGKNIAGRYSGALDNGGEHIRLEDAIGRTILDFNYADNWQDVTDGDGFSLNILDATADANNWNKQESWAASKYVGGTPGAGDSGLLKEHSIAINELLAHSDASPGDWVELKNTTVASINIGNWYLSDDADNLTKYRIKAGTTIASGAYLVLSSDANFGPASSDPGKLASFGFSEYGETAYLTSSDAGQLTGYREKEDFNASENGVTFGRYQKSAGTYDFVEMSSNTPGSANAYPKVGPVVINEIMYNPPNLNGQNSEYIELRNITGSTVNLFGFNNLPWKFTDGINYTFPAGTTIPANGYLLVVRTTPTYFRTKYSVPGGVTVLGPYNGWLSNAGEKIEISKPTDIDESGQPVYVPVDRVIYSDGSHPQDCPEGVDLWPKQADAGGKSLSRKVPTAYGNDPNNWQAATPSPGVANP